MKFKAGQKAVIACKETGWAGYELNGTVVTIVACDGIQFGFEYAGPRYSIDLPLYNGKAFECALEPLLEKGDYDRFMDRVMKPVDLGEPVAV